MSTENPTDVIEQAAEVIVRFWADTDSPEDAARALHAAGLLADPAALDIISSLR